MESGKRDLFLEKMS